MSIKSLCDPTGDLSIYAKKITLDGIPLTNLTKTGAGLAGLQGFANWNSSSKTFTVQEGIIEVDNIKYRSRTYKGQFDIPGDSTVADGTVQIVDPEIGLGWVLGQSLSIAVGVFSNNMTAVFDSMTQLSFNPAGPGLGNHNFNATTPGSVLVVGNIYRVHLDTLIYDAANPIV
jgi:hypothetical protein